MLILTEEDVAPVRDQVVNQVWKQVYSQVRIQVWIQVRNQVCDQVWIQVRNQVLIEFGGKFTM
jgi:hypothetical protein